MLTACSRDVPTLAGTARNGCPLEPPKIPAYGLISGWLSTAWNRTQMTHNPEVEGSNPSPTTKLDQYVRHFTSFAKGQPDGAVVSHLSVEGPDRSPGLSLGLEPSRIRLAMALALGRPCRE